MSEGELERVVFCAVPQIHMGIIAGVEGTVHFNSGYFESESNLIHPDLFFIHMILLLECNCSCLRFVYFFIF